MMLGKLDNNKDMLQKLIFLKLELGNLSPESSKTEWNTYFDWQLMD